MYSDPVGAKCWNVWSDSWNARCPWKSLKKWLVSHPYAAVHRGPGKKLSSHMTGKEDLNSWNLSFSDHCFVLFFGWLVLCLSEEKAMTVVLK